MADKDQLNEEFEFSDLDALNPEYSQETEKKADYKTEYSEQFADIPEATETGAWRNILILIAVIIILIIGYRLIASRFASVPEKKSPQVPAISQIRPAPATTAPVANRTPAPVMQAPVQTPDTATQRLEKKISQLEIRQQGLDSRISAMNSQFSDLNGNFSEVSDQLSQLNQAIAQLSNRLQEQSDEIAALKMRLRKPVTKTRHSARIVKKPIIYHIQALIPGRAWLNATNGSTLTVSEGSYISGYGTVKLIDPAEGIVLTSSGKRITFKHQDN